LEEDLDEVIHAKMLEYLPDADGDAIAYLQDAKNNHMVMLVEKLTHDDCKTIYEHYNFACLKEVMQ
jgi:putative ATP-dependent endonuclease of OLD family